MGWSVIHMSHVELQETLGLVGLGPIVDGYWVLDVSYPLYYLIVSNLPL